MRWNHALFPFITLLFAGALHAMQKASISEQLKTLHDAKTAEDVHKIMKANDRPDVNGRISGATALHNACKNGNREVILALLRYKADLKAENKLRDWPLDTATQNDRLDVVSDARFSDGPLEVGQRCGESLDN